MNQTEAAIAKLRKAQASAACIHKPLIDDAIGVLAQTHDASQIGKHLRRMRKKRKLSMQAVYDLTGYDVSRLSEIERGLRNPSLATLQKLATAYGEPITISFEPEKVKK
jgi:hypothetical protein